jgi:hypothetical protein
MNVDKNNWNSVFLPILKDALTSIYPKSHNKNKTIWDLELVNKEKVIPLVFLSFGNLDLTVRAINFMSQVRKEQEIPVEEIEEIQEEFSPDEEIKTPNSGVETYNSRYEKNKNYEELKETISAMNFLRNHTKTNYSSPPFQVSKKKRFNAWWYQKKLF